MWRSSGAGLFQLLHLYSPILCRYVTCPASICMLLVLLCTARQSLNADCASRQYPEQHQRFCIVNSMLQSKGRQEIDVFGSHFFYKNQASSCILSGVTGYSLIWGLTISMGHILMPQYHHCHCGPSCFLLHIFCFFSSPFSSRANRP